LLFLRNSTWNRLNNRSRVLDNAFVLVNDLLSKILWNFVLMAVLKNTKDAIYLLSSIDRTIRCHQLRTNIFQMLCHDQCVF
jgi:hypothetical protein